MLQDTYSQFAKDELILRDQLAADRTLLANEATFLAYIRTSFTIFIAGITIIHFFTTVFMGIIGTSFMLLGGIIFYLGNRRYRFMKKQIIQVKHAANSNLEQFEEKIQDQHEIRHALEAAGTYFKFLKKKKFLN